jgi:hypothetical protein
VRIYIARVCFGGQEILDMDRGRFCERPQVVRESSGKDGTSGGLCDSTTGVLFAAYYFIISCGGGTAYNTFPSGVFDELWKFGSIIQLYLLYLLTSLALKSFNNSYSLLANGFISFVICVTYLVEC